MRGAAAVVVLVVALCACGGGGKASSDTTTTTAEAPTTTTIGLSDAATIWCNDPTHLTAIQQADVTLRIAPRVVVQEQDYRNPDGVTRNIAGLERAYNTANSDPSNYPHYAAPVTNLPPDVWLVTGSPWAWWAHDDWVRLCNAAFGAR